MTKGRVTDVSLFENGREACFVRYRYDAAGNMVETIDANDVSKYFRYEGHLLVKLTNRICNIHIICANLFHPCHLCARVFLPENHLNEC